ncbi:hypothetical protein EBZ39_02335 [bacterium]|nr:hypothetical protein [bacterium]
MKIDHIISLNNRATLLHELYVREIKSVVAKFSGSGDSGSVYELIATSIDDEPIAQDDLEHMFLELQPTNDSLSMHWTGSVGYEKRNFKKDPLRLSELLIDICYEFLELESPGWEINSGSSGSITFTTPEKGIEKTHSAIVLEIEHDYDDDYDDDE